MIQIPPARPGSEDKYNMYNIFLNNKYSVWYNLIITRSQNKARVKLKKDDAQYRYFERHHIIPKSLGGSNDRENLVLLTAREHYICHLLLIKMCVSKKHYRKMLYAFNRIINKSSTKVINSSMYERLRTEFSIMKSETSKGELNNFYGKTHTPETKSYLAGVCSHYGDDNGFFGKTHTVETRKIISISAKARTNVPPPPQIGSKNHFAKDYLITDPLGDSLIIKCMKEFCEVNNLCCRTMIFYRNKGVIPLQEFERPYRVKNINEKKKCEGYSVKSITDPSGILPSIDQTVT